MIRSLLCIGGPIHWLTKRITYSSNELIHIENGYPHVYTIPPHPFPAFLYHESLTLPQAFAKLAELSEHVQIS
jgi:hypothetical protein